MSLIVEKEEESISDPFYSFGANVAKRTPPNERARQLRKDANLHASAVGDQVPVYSGNTTNKRFISKSGKPIATQTPNHSNYRYNTSTDNPHQAQVQNAKLSALIVERAMKLKK